MINYNIRIKGNVQGVGYRYAAYQKANILGVKGTVKNLEDGSVEILARANPPQMETFVQWCTNGPDAAIVEDIATNEVADFNSHEFKIVR